MTSGSPALRKSVIVVLAIVIAGAVHLLYGAISFFAKQIFGDTAVGTYLLRLASIFGITPIPASYAIGPVDFTGTNGTVIEVGKRVQRSDGKLYEVQAQVMVASGVATATVKAVDAGVDGNTAAGVEMILVSPIAGLNSKALVGTGGIVDGVEVEGTESVRERFLDRVRQPPQGGAAPDFVRWAKEVAGVTRAWAYQNPMGPGTVGVTFVTDNENNIIPGPSKVAEVKAYIDTKRPVTDDLFVYAPTESATPLSIKLTPDTPTIRAAVTAELDDLFRREAEPGGKIYLSHINEAISLAAGETDHILSVPSADVTPAAGVLATRGTITWVP